MLDQAAINELKFILCDRLTADELVEALGLTADQIFDRFVDECLELDLEEVL